MPQEYLDIRSNRFEDNKERILKEKLSILQRLLL